MVKKTKKTKEGVDCIYKDGKLSAIIKRDDGSKKHLIYLVSEATSDDIADMLADNGFMVENYEKENSGGLDEF